MDKEDKIINIKCCDLHLCIIEHGIIKKFACDRCHRVYEISCIESNYFTKTLAEDQN